LTRPTWAEVDLAAVGANVTALRDLVGPAEVMAVVKADGYGHGAANVARAALEAGASSLAVATGDEALALRDVGVSGRILVLSDLTPEAIDDVARHDLDLTVSTRASIEAAIAAGVSRLHLKVDTGMHRVGCDPVDVVDLARRCGDSFAALWSHLAEADEPASPATARQLERFDRVVDDLVAAGISPPTVHLANSAGALAHPRARLDAVRCGIAMYGIAPSPTLANVVSLRPALSLHSRVRALRSIDAGEAVSYGGRWRAAAAARIATIPIGYADGVPRRFGLVGGEVLVRGRRCPIRGVVTMDQTMVEVDADVALDDEVVLIGGQGDEHIDAWEWARLLDTIAYEIVTGIGPRVLRRYSS
jgi:alanine racemase